MNDKKYKDHYARKADHEIPKTRCPVETFALKWNIPQYTANKLLMGKNEQDTAEKIELLDKLLENTKGAS